jgi:hypothetical protein
MSVHVSSVVWKWDAPDPHSKLVLLKLADNADDDGRCWPSLQRIERETGLSHSTVCDRLRKLEEAGVIDRRPGGSTPGERGGQNTRYRIHTEKLSATRTDSKPDAEPDGKPDGKPDGNPDGKPTSPPDALPGSAPDGQEVVRHTDTNHQRNHQIKPSKAQASPAPSARWNLAFEMLVKIQGSKLDALTRNERGAINVALRDIREVMPDMDDEKLAQEIKRRAREYVDGERMPKGATLTALAVAKNWSRLSASSQSGSVGESPPPRKPPRGWELVMDRLYGYPEWRMVWPCWERVEPSDQSQVRRWLAVHGPIDYEWKAVCWHLYEFEPVGWADQTRRDSERFRKTWEGWTETERQTAIHRYTHRITTPAETNPIPT